MKTVILVRHSEPIKDRTMPTEELPLSEQGHIKAQELFSLDMKDMLRVFTEDDLSEFFYYQKDGKWLYDLK